MDRRHHRKESGLRRLLTRTEATGFGLCYFGAAYLADHGQSFQGKKVIISGSGNVATYAIRSAPRWEPPWWP